MTIVPLHQNQNESEEAFRSRCEAVADLHKAVGLSIFHAPGMPAGAAGRDETQAMIEIVVWFLTVGTLINAYLDHRSAQLESRLRKLNTELYEQKIRMLELRVKMLETFVLKGPK